MFVVGQAKLTPEDLHYLEFSVRENYTPGGILDKGAILPNGLTVAIQESKPFYLTFRVTQYLKLKR